LKRFSVALAFGIAASSALNVAIMPAAFAQDQAAAPASFPDVPQNHWAYQAVTDLASKGYVKGYPEGVFLGQRVMTRYEFALKRLSLGVNS